MLNSLVFAFTILMASHAIAAAQPNRCESLFSSQGAQQRMTARKSVTIDPRIPQRQREIIVDTLKKVDALTSGLKRPEHITFEWANNGTHEGGYADFLKQKIGISDLGMRLSEASFRAMIAHEVTHLYVVENFKDASSPDSGRSLRDAMVAKQDDDFEVQMLARPHIPLAELLCDTMAILVSRDPKSLSNLVNEMIGLAEKHPEHRALVERLNADQPVDLSRRDFSLSHTDARWDSYTPRDQDYNRFNQTRAYLWGRWISQLPPGSAPRFFAKLVESLSPLAASGQLDMLTAMNGVAETNTALISYLDGALAR